MILVGFENSKEIDFFFIFTGFMTNQEKELFQVVPCNEFNTYWIPCTWFVYRIQEAAKKGKLLNDYAIETIMRVRVIRVKHHKMYSSNA